jgi:bacterioferritin-associated ferredoxin
MPRDLKPPFKFDIRNIVDRLRKLPVSVDGVTIALPFVEVTLKPDGRERKVAREVVIRLADRRVLNASECCDGCIESALKSLQEIRQTIVEKQVELSSKTDGVLFLLLDSIRDAIRQFLTFEQRLTTNHPHVFCSDCTVCVSGFLEP